MSGAQPPGWYPAPGSPTVQRWWDGIRWTGEVRETDNPAGANALTAKFADSPTVAGQAMPTQPPAGKTREPAGKTREAAPSAPETPPEAEARVEAAWRTPAVEAWETRTAPEQPRKLSRWLGRTKHR